MKEYFKQVMSYSQALSEENETQVDGYILNLANSLWFRNNNLEIFENYIQQIKNFYRGDILSVDFGKEDTKDYMNSWINERTNHLLKGTIKQTNPMDLVYLVNTIYFKAQWMDNFSENLTTQEDFHIDETTIQTDMMHQKKQLRYFEDDHYQILRLDYHKGGMYILLSKESLKKNFKHLSCSYIEESFEAMDFKEVDLSLPKFDYKDNHNLIPLLKELGVTSIFSSETANFTRLIKSDQKAFVSKDFQNAKITIDEKGTEAGAVTVIALAEEAMPESDEVIKMQCNRPFIYIIKDDKTNSHLFIGLINNPNN